MEQRGAASARQQQTDTEALLVLDRARGLLEDAWDKHDLGKLAEARAEADRAADIARTGSGSPATQSLASTFQADARQRVERAQKNQTLLTEFLDVSAPRETSNYQSDDAGQMTATLQPSEDEQYAAAFARWGLVVDATEESQVVARLQQEPQRLVQAIVAGLDGWMLARRAQRSPEPKWRRLARIADQLDPSERGRQLRRLMLNEAPVRAQSVAGLCGAWPPWLAVWDLQRGQGSRGLFELLPHADPASEPTLSILQLARTCRSLGNDPAAEKILRQSVAVRPNEIVLFNELGRLLEDQNPPRWGEAIECYRVNRALNPRSGITLASSLHAAGRSAEAESILLELIRLDQNNPEKHFHLGYVALGQRKWENAERACRAATYLKANYVEAYNNLGFALIQQKKATEAETVFRQAIHFRPDYALAYNNLCNALRYQKRLDEAAAACRKAIDLQSNYADAYVNLAGVLRDQKNYEKALATCRKAIELKPDYAAAYVNLGRILHDQQKLDESTRAYRKAIELMPGYGLAYTNLSSILREQRMLEEALAANRTAIDLNPLSADAYTNLGLVLHDQKKLDEAIAAHRKAIDLQPDHAEAYNNLGNVLSDQKRLDEATAAHRKAVQFKPAEAILQRNLAVALRQQKKLDEAEAVCRAAIDLDADYAEAYYTLGNILCDQNQLEESVAAYHKAIAINPNDALFYNGLGIALREQKDFNAAVTNLETAISLNPEFASAHHNLALALNDVSEFQRAVEMHRKAIALNPEDALYHTGLGNALRAMKNDDEAVASFERAIALDPKSPKVRFDLGMVLLKQGHFNAARESFQKTLALAADEELLRKRASFRVQECTRRLAIEEREKENLVDLGAARTGITGRLTSEDFVDVFPLGPQSFRKGHLVPLRAGVHYQIDLTGDFDTLLRIEDAQQQPLVFNDDVTPPGGLSSRIVFTPPKDGCYRLIVNSGTIKAIGRYTLKVQQAARLGQTLFTGVLGTEEADDDGKHQQKYKIKLTAGTPYVFELESQKFDTFLALLDRDGHSVLITNDDAAPNDLTRSRLDFTPQASGEYTLVVTSFKPAQTGAFTLKVCSYAVVKRGD
jgi:tetratricopeptide (TPR) repeat protein